MALLDSIVSASFRDEPAGKVVVFPSDRRNRGYIVKSPADETKIKSFLKMFYCAHFSILLLGYFLAASWSYDLNQALGRPALHVYRTMGIALAMFSLVYGLPYLLFWRVYKKAILSFVLPEDEVSVSGKRVGWQRILIAVALLLLGISLFFAVSPKH